MKLSEYKNQKYNENKKNFAASLSNVKADKFYVVTTPNPDKHVGIEKGEFLLNMFKRDNKLPGTDIFVLNTDGYDSEEDAIKAVKESEYSFADEMDNFSNLKMPCRLNNKNFAKPNGTAIRFKINKFDYQDDKEIDKFVEFLDEEFGESNFLLDKIGLKLDEGEVILRISDKNADWDLDVSNVVKIINDYADKNLEGVTFTTDGEKHGEILKTSFDFSAIKLPYRMHKNF